RSLTSSLSNSLHCPCNHIDRLSFPTRRSSDLAPGRFCLYLGLRSATMEAVPRPITGRKEVSYVSDRQFHRQRRRQGHRTAGCVPDRKSTRLSSSHVSISYAVFCLKKNNQIKIT